MISKRQLTWEEVTLAFTRNVFDPDGENRPLIKQAIESSPTSRLEVTIHRGQPSEHTLVLTMDGDKVNEDPETGRRFHETDDQFTCDEVLDLIDELRRLIGLDGFDSKSPDARWSSCYR